MPDPDLHHRPSDPQIARDIALAAADVGLHPREAWVEQYLVEEGYWHRDIDTFQWLDMVLQQRACLTPKLHRSLTQPERTLDACLRHTFYPGPGQLERWADPESGRSSAS